jgi:hypothetical protein
VPDCTPRSRQHSYAPTLVGTQLPPRGRTYDGDTASPSVLESLPISGLLDHAQLEALLRNLSGPVTVLTVSSLLPRPEAELLPGSSGPTATPPSGRLLSGLTGGRTAAAAASGQHACEVRHVASPAELGGELVLSLNTELGTAALRCLRSNDAALRELELSRQEVRGRCRTESDRIRGQNGQQHQTRTTEGSVQACCAWTGTVVPYVDEKMKM